MNAAEEAKSSGWLGSLPFLLVGLALFAGAVYFFERQRVFYASAVRAEAVVVDQVPYRSKSYSGWQPILRFQTATGAHDFKGAVRKSRFENGERIRVAYLPSNPAEARTDSVLQRWGLVAGLALLGSGFAYFGISK